LKSKAEEDQAKDLQQSEQHTEAQQLVFDLTQELENMHQQQAEYRSDVQRLKIQGAMRECIRRYFLREVALGMEKQIEEKQ